MDYDQESDSRGLHSGVFYGAAAFIFVLIALFASFVLKEEGTLGHWHIITCLLGTGLISILLFIPHFLQVFMERVEELNARENNDLASKAFFELKEIRSEIDALVIKVDKVPTLVNKIVSDSLIHQSQDEPDKILQRLDVLTEDIRTKLEHIEEVNLNPSPLPQSSEEIIAIQEDIKLINSQVSAVRENLERSFSSREEKTEESNELSTDSERSEQISEEEIASDLTTAESDEIIGNEVQESESTAEESREDQISETTEESAVEDIPELEIPSSDGTEEALPLDEKVENQQEIFLSPSPKMSSLPPTKGENKISEELNLGLPDPKETIRKVDALLAGEDISKSPEKLESGKPKTDQNGTTTVVANVMIGIGNKPYLRGDGPGLNWDEGVSMNFVEIGKWAWSSPRKNASLTVQIYRNDQDPDQGGKFEVKPGQRLEITPDFS